MISMLVLSPVCVLQIVELPSRVAAALLSLMTSAIYDLESLKKVGSHGFLHI